MNLRLFIVLFLVVALTASFCLNECLGQGRRPGQPPPKQEPKGPERNIPGWTEASGSIPDDKEEAKKATVFEHFSATSECKMEKPFIIYFYTPDEGKLTKTALACSKFEKGLTEASNVQGALNDFGCYKCNTKELDKKLVTKYGAKAPIIVIFDATGKKVHKITKITKSDKTVAKKLESIKKTSDKASEKAKDKEENKDK